MSFTLQEGIIATVVGGLILAVIGWVISRVWSAFSSVSKQEMFSIRFVDHDPPGSTETPLGSFYEIPLGRSDHWVKVVTNEGLVIDEVNLRFLSCEEAHKKPDNSPEDIREVISIMEVNLTPEIFAQGMKAVQTQDRHGGIDIKLIPAYPLGTMRAMFLRISVEAKQIWSGKISFRTNDKDHHPRYARTDVRVTESSYISQQSKLGTIWATVTDSQSKTIVKIPD